MIVAMCINTAHLHLHLTSMGYKEFSRFFLTLTVNTEGNINNLIVKSNKTFLTTTLLKFLPKNEKLYCNKQRVFNCLKRKKLCYMV
jgi:hypothetical protein